MSDLVDGHDLPLAYKVGERVQVLLDSTFWGQLGWLDGTVVGVEPYSEHRSFYWIQLQEVADISGNAPGLISVINLRNIRRRPET